MPPRFPEYWRRHPDSTVYRMQLSRMGGVRRVCTDDTGNEIPCFGGEGDPPEPEEKPYRAQIHLYQPNRLKNKPPGRYDLHWQMGWYHNSSYSSRNQTSLLNPLEEGFVTRYSKGGNYYMKLWYDTDDNKQFDREVDRWFAKFKLGRTKQRGKFDFADLTGKQFIKKIDRTIYLDFAFPNEHYLNKHKDSDKYLFVRTDELKALLFKTLAKWDGYKGIGLEKAIIYPRYTYQNIYGQIGQGFDTSGSNSKRQLIDDLTTYPMRVKRKEVTMQMIDLEFEEYENTEKYGNIKAVFTGSPKVNGDFDFLVQPTFHLVFENKKKMSLYLSRNDAGAIFDPSDILIASGRIYDDRFWRAPKNRYRHLKLKFSSISSVKEKTWVNELMETYTQNELKKTEEEDNLIEYGFYHDIINDRIDNNDDRLGFSDLEIKRRYVFSGYFWGPDKVRLGDFSPHESDMTYQYPGSVPPTPW